jgi:hypothetical protein
MPLNSASFENQESVVKILWCTSLGTDHLTFSGWGNVFHTNQKSDFFRHEKLVIKIFLSNLMKNFRTENLKTNPKS